MIHLIAVLAVLALVVATLPGTCELALLTVGGILRPRHPLRQPARPPSVIARVAIVIPAHDEAGLDRAMRSKSFAMRPCAMRDCDDHRRCRR